MRVPRRVIRGLLICVAAGAVSTPAVSAGLALRRPTLHVRNSGQAAVAGRYHAAETLRSVGVERIAVSRYGFDSPDVGARVTRVPRHAAIPDPGGSWHWAYAWAYGWPFPCMFGTAQAAGRTPKPTLSPGGWRLAHFVVLSDPTPSLVYPAPDRDGTVCIPTGILPGPFAASWAVHSASWTFLLVGWPELRRHLRRRRLACPTCNYDRRGLAPDAKCPECGFVPPPRA
jgi:hypothetical protein